MKRLWAAVGLGVGLVIGYLGAVVAAVVASKTVGRVERGYVDFDGEPCATLGCEPKPHAHMQVVTR